MITITTRWMFPVRQTVTALSGFKVRNPITMSSPAREGIASLPTAPVNSRVMMAMTTPAKMLARRVRAPLLTMSAVADTEPPTGIPRKKPAATLAAPCATKSREASG